MKLNIVWYCLAFLLYGVCNVHAQTVFDDIIVNNSSTLNGVLVVSGAAAIEGDTEIIGDLSISDDVVVSASLLEQIGDLSNLDFEMGRFGSIRGASDPANGDLEERLFIGAEGEEVQIDGEEIRFRGPAVFQNGVSVRPLSFNAPAIQWGMNGAELTTDQGASIELRGIGVPYIDFSNDPNNPNADFDMRFILANDDVLGVDGGTLAIVDGGGLITDPDALIPHKLYVGGSMFTENLSVAQTILANNIIADEILIEDIGDFPDFVFEEDYNLVSLEEVAEYIAEHGHLKGIPSAEEVKENGFSLGSLSKMLLQKIEELTLYTIDQDKEINSLEDQYQQDLEILKQQIAELSAKMDE